MRRLIAAALLAGMARGVAAQTPESSIDGSWFRVYEKCFQPLKALPDFEATGGDRLIKRRMLLTIDGGRFTAISFMSLRCKPSRNGNYEADENLGFGHADDAFDIDCHPKLENSGELARTGFQLYLTATDPLNGGNGWGTTFKNFQFRFIGQVLELTTTESRLDCFGAGPFYTYWIRNPDS